MRFKNICLPGPQRVATQGVRALIIVLATVTSIFPLAVNSHASASDQEMKEVESGLNRLIEFCGSDQGYTAVDFNQIKPVVEFIQQAPEKAKFQPAERGDTKGSFIAFSVNRTIADIIRYAYNSHIPEGAINASSVNYSYWKQVSQTGSHQAPEIWKQLDDLSKPFVARGVVREAIAPDLHTGTYYEYDLQRAFLIYRQGQSRVMLSLSTQIGSSDVGKKGYIIGQDRDWNYLYTQDTGLNKPGLGWVKPKISRYYSICCFIEDQTDTGHVKIGIFQWLAAGWIGMNVVDSHHIRRGLERFAQQFKSMVESEHMPAPVVLEKVCRSLEQTDEAILREKAMDVTRHIQEKAAQEEGLRDKPAIQKLNAASYVAAMKKEQLVTILMREYLKYCLGKETPLSPTFWVALKTAPPASGGGQPLS